MMTFEPTVILCDGKFHAWHTGGGQRRFVERFIHSSIFYRRGIPMVLK